jgi:hypothetical protein
VLAIIVRFSIEAYLLAGPHSTLSDPVPDLMLRMTVLTDLYLQSLTPQLEEFWNRITSVENANKRQYNAQDGYGHVTKGNTDEFDKAKEEYMKSFSEFRERLQELAKKSS